MNATISLPDDQWQKMAAATQASACNVWPLEVQPLWGSGAEGWEPRLVDGS